MQSLTPSIISHGALQAHSRTLVKTLTYRLLMVLVTITVAFLVTGNGSDAVNIGIAANLLKTGTYYGYERLWAHISWGLDDG